MFLQNAETFKSTVQGSKFQGFYHICASIFALILHHFFMFFLEPFVDRLFYDFSGFSTKNYDFGHPLATQGEPKTVHFGGMFGSKVDFCVHRRMREALRDGTNGG